jgi:hypothetical protein
VDVYLLPAIVGGGIGDIDEVVCAARTLARAGFALTLFRRAGRPLPRGVDGPWGWPPLRRVDALAPRAPRAVTVAPAWGIVAAPARDEPLGRAGPWAEEAGEIERVYGTERTLHVSLEEFARTLTSREETVERLREGGVRSRAVPARRRAAEADGEVQAFRAAFRRFRAFDRPNVLTLFATFRYDRAFAREHPESIQVGPLWPRQHPRRASGGVARAWVWYASPASSEEIAPAVLAGLRSVVPSPFLSVRSPGPWTRLAANGGWRQTTTPLPSGAWRREFRSAALRIVTGSRSLLEALELEGPFLYFNGVLGRGPARRRHRPEKIVAFLRLARQAGWPADLLSDLADFSRGRRVREIVRRATSATGSWDRFPPTPPPAGFAPGFEDAGRLLVRLVREFGSGQAGSSELVDRLRRASHR